MFDVNELLVLAEREATQHNLKKSWIKYINIYFLDIFLGKQAVLVLSCDNAHMSEDVMVEPGLVMIFAHGIE